MKSFLHLYIMTFTGLIAVNACTSTSDHQSTQEEELTSTVVPPIFTLYQIDGEDKDNKEKIDLVCMRTCSKVPQPADIDEEDILDVCSKHSARVVAADVLRASVSTSDDAETYAMSSVLAVIRKGPGVFRIAKGQKQVDAFMAKIFTSYAASKANGTKLCEQIPNPNEFEIIDGEELFPELDMKLNEDPAPAE